MLAGIRIAQDDLKSSAFQVEIRVISKCLGVEVK